MPICTLMSSAEKIDVRVPKINVERLDIITLFSVEYGEMLLLGSPAALRAMEKALKDVDLKRPEETK